MFTVQRADRHSHVPFALAAEVHGLTIMPFASRLRPDRLEPGKAAGPATLPPAVRDHLGAELQAVYRELITPRPPRPLLDLLTQLDTVLSARGCEQAAAFRDGLTKALPALRGFALSLASNEVRADDLVQETLLKAWAKQEQFVPGTSLKAWLFTILRNQFYSECRRHRREVEDAEGALAAKLTAPAAQEHCLDLRKVWAALDKLPTAQREALLLVGAQGLTYEAAAGILGCQTGTVKSRVSRARAHLVETLVEPLSSVAA